MTYRELEEMIRKAAGHAVPDRLDAILAQCMPARQQPARAALPALPFRFSRIIFDVNPSVSLEVDDDEKVAAAVPLNADAEGILSGLSLTGRPLGEAVDAIVEAMVDRGYLNEVSNSILVSVQNSDAKRQEELQREVSRMVVDVMIESLGSTEEEASVISQGLNEDAELSELAAAYGISEGKAALIRKLIDSRKQSGTAGTPKGKRYTFADLAAMSVNDLALLAEEENMYDNTVTRMGRPSEGAYIGHRQALDNALAFLGIGMPQVYRHSVKFDCKKGLMVYKVKLGTCNGLFKVYLDARTGNVVRCKRKGRGKKRYGYRKHYKYMGGRNYQMGRNYNYNYDAYENIPMPEGVIGEEQAKKAALDHAGVTEGECQYVYCHPEVDHGRVEHYDVKFVANGMKYKYAIGLYDGAVLGRGVKDKGMKTGYVYEGNYHEHMAPPMGPGAGTPPMGQQPAPQSAPAPSCHDGVCEIPQQPQAAAPGPMPQTPPPVMQGMPNMSGDMISEDEALNIALNHAQLTMNDVFRWRVKLLTKHGRMIYRIKLKVMGYEYEIDVDAYNGAICKAHKEVDF